MIYPLDIDKQREQLFKVVDYFKSIGIKQKEIAARIGQDTVTFSQLFSGAKKYIPQEMIENLHTEYGVNPKFITEGAHNMFDILGIKYEHFEKFVDSWDLVDYEENSYLHFTIDENFYNFLLDVYSQKEVSNDIKNPDNITNALNKVIETLKNKYADAPNNKEYVLIPVDKVEEIIQGNLKSRKQLSEVVEILGIG